MPAAPIQVGATTSSFLSAGPAVPARPSPTHQLGARLPRPYPLHLSLLPWEEGRAPLHMCHQNAFSYFRSFFQDKKWCAGKEKLCLGELVQVSQGGCGTEGRFGTDTWVVGSQNLWAALSTGSSTDSQTVFLLLLPWGWEMLFCRDSGKPRMGEERSEIASLSQTQHMLL